MTTVDNTVADNIVALKQSLSTQIPAEFGSVFEAEQAELSATAVPAGVASPGVAMPDPSLLDVNGKPTSLSEARADSAAVVIFYRGAWCPYCNVALRTYQETLVPALDAQGVKLIAISPQKPDGSMSMQEKNELTFTVLSDPGNQIAGELGILTAPAEKVKQAQIGLGLDLAQVNADGTYAIPMPTTAIVSADGILRWIDVHPDYSSRTEPAAILKALAAELG